MVWILALDAVGINTLINLSMKLVKNNGKICSYGISPKLDMQIDWSGAPYNWQLHFHQFPSKIAEGECHRQVLAWVMNGVLDPDDFISDIYAFNEVIEAFGLVEHKKAERENRYPIFERGKRCCIHLHYWALLPEDSVSTPDGMAIDKDGNLILACPNFADHHALPGCLMKISKDLKVTKWVDVPVRQDTGLASPMGIAFGPDGDLFICDNQSWPGDPELQFKGRMLRIRIENDQVIRTTVVADGMEHPNGCRVHNGYLYVTQSMLTEVKDPSGYLVSCVYRFPIEAEQDSIDQYTCR